MPTAILSVFDKTGLVEFASGLRELDWTLLASGGTARLLLENGIEVKEVSEYTQSPEILSGRVKTLHPAVHGGLLARSTDEDRQQLLDLGWDTIDLVAVNLYPFEDTVAKSDVSEEDVIENIDIGGVTLIRAAAKNFDRVTLLCDPMDYDQVLTQLKEDSLSRETRKQLALKGFKETAKYDAAISAWFAGEEMLNLNLYNIQSLRYGENPHQSASVYSYEAGSGPLGGKVLQGKALSYNNLLDLDAAWRAAVSFEEPTIVINKHLSPCGIASNSVLAEAYKDALASDPISAFGSVIASNIILDEGTALEMKSLFIECIIAPGFTAEAREILAKKKNCRLVEMPFTTLSPDYELRSINGGMLMQALDFGDPQDAEWKVVSKRQPNDEEWQALRFAMKACQHAKSNAIVFAKHTATVGVGSGQPNRVDCVHIAAQRAGEKSKGAVMASDAFFPFPDSVEAAAEYGITAIVQPGGSIRDELSVEAADRLGMVMIVTGARHFRH